MDGIRTKKLVIEPTEAAFVRQMYEMYADPQVSLHDITRKLTADGMRTNRGRPLSRATLSVILRNPIYVMADLDIYEFFKSQGTDIYNDGRRLCGDKTAAITIRARATRRTSTGTCKGKRWCLPPARDLSPRSCG